MSTNIRIVLDTRVKKKDNTYPLVIRIWHNRRNISIPLGYSMCDYDWDDTKKEVKKSFKGVSNITRLNKLIQSKKIKAMDIVNELQDSGEIDNLTVKEIKARIVSQNSSQTFFVFSDELINELKEAGRFSYAQSINNTLNAVKKFANEKDFTFKQLNYKFLVQFENSCRGRDLAINSIAVYLRNIKMIFNRAIKAGIVKKELYPFTGFPIKTTKTRKRAVRIDVIHLIEAIELPENTRIWNAKNYFLFSFYTMGMNFVDMAHLKLENITEGRLEFARQKTKKNYSIKVTESIQKIIDLYCEGKKKSDFIFPIISRVGNPLFEYRDAHDGRRVYNKMLKEIAELCGIESNLTSYVSRHSWATIAKHKGVPVAVISEGMGHTDVKTTDIYLDSFDKEVLDDFNEMITG